LSAAKVIDPVGVPSTHLPLAAGSPHQIDGFQVPARSPPQAVVPQTALLLMLADARDSKHGP